MKYGLFIIISLIFGCSSIPTSFNEVTADIKLLEGGTAIYFKGKTSEANVDALIRTAEQSSSRISNLIVNSGGGDVYGGMKFGQWVYDQKLKLTVSKLCFSSCANYVFTAAREVVVEASSIVGWHGGSLQKDWDIPWYLKMNPWWKSSFNAGIEEWQNLESEYFSKIGVNQQITVLGQRELFVGKRTGDGWTFSTRNLEILGVTNVTFEDTEPCLSNEYITVDLIDIEPKKLLSLLNQSRT